MVNLRVSKLLIGSVNQYFPDSDPEKKFILTSSLKKQSKFSDVK